MYSRNSFYSIPSMCLKYGLLLFVLTLNFNGVQSNSLWPPKLLRKLKPEEKAQQLPPPTKNLGASDVNPCIRNGCKIFGPLCEHGKCTESVSLNSCQWMCSCEPGWRGYLCEERDTGESISKGAQIINWDTKPESERPKVSKITTKTHKTTTTSTTTTVAPATVTVNTDVTTTSTIVTPTTTDQPHTTSVELGSTPSLTTTAVIAQTVTKDVSTESASTTTKTIANHETTTGVPVLRTTIDADTSVTTGVTTDASTRGTTMIPSTTTQKTSSEYSTIPHTSTLSFDAVSVTSTRIISQPTSLTTPNKSVTSTVPVSTTKSTILIEPNFPRTSAQTQRSINTERTSTTTVSQELSKTQSVTAATDKPAMTTTSIPLTKTTTIIDSTANVQDTTYISSGEKVKQPVVTAGQIRPDARQTQALSTLKPTTDGSTINIHSSTLSTSTQLPITTTTIKSHSSKALPPMSPSTTTKTPSATVVLPSTRVSQSTTRSVSSTTRQLVQNVKLGLHHALSSPEEVVLFPPRLAGKKRKPVISATFDRKPQLSSQEETVLLPEILTNSNKKPGTTPKPVVKTKNTVHQSILKDIKKMHTFFTNLRGTARNILPDNKTV